MRFRTKCMLLVPLVVAGLVYSVLTQQLEKLNLASKEVNRDDAQRQITVRITQDDWTSFQLPHESKTLRMMTNAAFAKDATPVPTHFDPRPGWRYSIEYQLLDVRGNVIKESVYHFRSRIRQLIDSTTGQIINPLVFGKSGMLSTQTRMMQIPIDQTKQKASVIRARIASMDPQVQEIVARIATRVERKDYNDPGTWKALSREGRRSIAKFCVFDHDILSQHERANLLRWHWTRATPVGRTENRFLYYIGDIDDQEALDEQLPAGMYVEPGWVGTVPVPQSKGNLRLEFLRLQVSQDRPIDINIRWTGKQPSQNLALSHRVKKIPQPFSFPAEGGLTEIETTEPIVIRAFWDQPNSEIMEMFESRPLNDNGEIEITPISLTTRQYLTENDDVEFPISHTNGQSTPFRATFRFSFNHFFELDPGLEHELEPNVQERPWNHSVVWRYLNQHNEVVDRGKIDIEPELSAYDRIWLSGQPQMVSEPIKYFFHVPPDACKIQFTSTQPTLLVSGAVRPAKLPSMTRVPEDYLSFYRSRSPFRRWFTLKPNDYLDLIRDNRSVVLRLQARPTEVDPEIAAGNYQWHRFEPSGSPIGRQILVPFDDSLEVRRQVIDSLYYEVLPSQLYEFSAHEDRSAAHPKRLIFLADQSPGTIQIKLNGKSIYAETALSKRGEIDLQTLLTDSHGTLSVNSEFPMRAFLGGIRLKSATPFLKRTASRLKDGKLTFDYEKVTDDQELVTLKIYRSASHDQRCSVHVKILSHLDQPRSQPEQDWTIPVRQYSIRAVDEEASLLLGTDAKVDTGHRCFIKLGKDFPAGHYTIVVESLDAIKTGYVLMYETRPGQAPIRHIKTKRRTHPITMTRPQ